MKILFEYSIKTDTMTFTHWAPSYDIAKKEIAEHFKTVKHIESTGKRIDL
jgi:hypothetical protein